MHAKHLTVTSDLGDCTEVDDRAYGCTEHSY